MKRTTALVALTLFALTGTASAAAAGDSRDACKHGGFSQYVDPATGQPFKNQGKCVSYVTQGGTLAPVAPPEPAVPEVVVTIQPNPSGSGCLLSASYSAEPFGYHTLVWTVSLVNFPGDYPVTLQTKPDGTQETGLITSVGSVVTGRIDGETFFPEQTISC